MEERLQKIMSRAGIASRRAAEQMIAEGRVTVDGRVVTELGTKVNPETREIRVDGKRIRHDRPRRYFVLNKPRGYVTTRSDPSGRPTVMELLPRSLRGLYPIGRLDTSTTGLLLLTDDGDFAQKVAHPRFEVEKTYVVTVRGTPNDRSLDRARKGVSVDGEMLAVKTMELLSAHRRREPRKTTPFGEEQKEKSKWRVVLVEGKNREIRRLFQALGHPVLELHRSKIGIVSDRGLPAGGYRPLTSWEVSRLGSSWSRSGGRRKTAPGRGEGRTV